MASADNLNNAEPLQIIQIATSKKKNGDTLHELKLNDENIKRIMLHPDVKDNPVMIVSIAGALRKGKSFLLGFFLKYLEAEMDANWLNEDDSIEGFEWRNGTDPVTHGIHIWSKPFLLESQSKGKVAILLMDTQGVFDCKSTKQESANIFTLSSLISSVQIYNLTHQIQEDDLENLEYFSEFGKLIQEKSGINDASKPRLIFLVRDWGCPHEFPYGNVGGEAYVLKQLREELNQQQQLKKIRQNLNGGFLEIGGFLLPYPGKVVATNHLYAGLVQDIEKEFLEFVKLLVPYVVSENKLTTKRMNCNDVKGRDMLVYIKDYVKFLKDGDYNTLETAVEDIAAAYRNSAFEKAHRLYKDEMEKFVERGLASLDDLQEHHTLTKKKSLNEFTDYPRIKVADHEHLSLMELEKKIEDTYPSYEKRAYAIAMEQRRSASQNAYKYYKDEMKKFFKKWDFLSLDVLKAEHILTKETSLKKFQNYERIQVADQEQLFFINLERTLEDKYQLYENRAFVVANKYRKSAFEKACELYETEMEKHFERSLFVTQNGLEKHHKLTKEKSLKEFTDCPRIRVAEREETFLTRLEHEIETKYPSYLERTIDKRIADGAGKMAIPCLLFLTITTGLVSGSPMIICSVAGPVAIYRYLSPRLH